MQETPAQAILKEIKFIIVIWEFYYKSLIYANCKLIFNSLIGALCSCKESVNCDEMRFSKDNISHSVFSTVYINNIHSENFSGYPAG